MTVQSKHHAWAPNPQNMWIVGSFVPNGTSAPAEATHRSNRKGITSVAYNGATGTWRITINRPIAAIVYASAGVIDNKTQVESYEANVVAFSDDNQTIDIELQYAADVNAGAYAASATVDRITYAINVNLSDLPANGT